MQSYNIPGTIKFDEWVGEVLLEADILSARRACESNKMRSYWSVEGHADMTHATDDQKNAVVGVGVGVGHKNGWLSLYNLAATSETDHDVHWESILGSYGFIEGRKLPRRAPRGGETVHNWMPLYTADIETITRNVYGSEAEKMEDQELVEAMFDSVEDFNTMCIAVRRTEQSTDTGVICVRRDLVIYPDKAVLVFSIKGFEGGGTKVARASLIAALHNQMIVDIETSYLALLCAGLDVRLTPEVQLGKDIDLDQSTALEVLEYALDAAFNAEWGPLPEWLDLGRWCDVVDTWQKVSK